MREDEPIGCTSRPQCAHINPLSFLVKRFCSMTVLRIEKSFFSHIITKEEECQDGTHTHALFAASLFSSMQRNGTLFAALAIGQTNIKRMVDLCKVAKKILFFFLLLTVLEKSYIILRYLYVMFYLKEEKT